MTKLLYGLDDHTDEATRKMIQHLIKKKKKFDHYQSLHFFLLSFFILYCLTFLLIVYTVIIIPNEYSVIEVISSFLGTSYIMFLFMISVLLFGAIKIYYEKKEKAEAEYHDLRCEIIEKSQDLWKEKYWHDRHLFFDQLKKEYDINLYYESK